MRGWDAGRISLFEREIGIIQGPHQQGEERRRPAERREVAIDPAAIGRLVEDIGDELVEWRRRLHQNPELSRQPCPEDEAG